MFGPIENLGLDLLSAPIAAQIKDFDATFHFTSEQANMMDRFLQFAVVAAREAMADSGLVITDDIAAMASLITGVGVCGMVTLDDSFHSLYGDKNKHCRLFTIPRLMPNAPISQISMDLGLKGTTFTVASACASGTYAIGLVFRAIRAGDTDIALSCGSEACVKVVHCLSGRGAARSVVDTCRSFFQGPE